MSLINRTLGAGYATPADVRAVSGIPAADVTDPELASLIVDASLILTDALATRVEGRTLSPDSPAKTTFRLGRAWVADLNVDGVVDAADVVVRFERANPETGATEYADPGAVTLTNPSQGWLTTANPLPDGYTPVVDFGYYSRPLDLSRAKRAVAYLAAHLAVIRMKGPGRITRADAQSVGETRETSRSIAYAQMRTKYLTLYEAVLSSMGAAVV